MASNSRSSRYLIELCCYEKKDVPLPSGLQLACLIPSNLVLENAVKPVSAVFNLKRDTLNLNNLGGVECTNNHPAFHSCRK